MTPLRFGFTILLLLAGAPIQARGTVIQSGGSWAAIDFGATCEARSRSLLAAPKGKPQANAAFAFTPDRKRWGEFAAQLSRPARAGSSVLLTIGAQPFLLVSRGDRAWSRGAAQEQAIIAAARVAEGMRIEARDSSGRRFTDRYGLGGAPTAIDAAAGRCALRNAGKI